MAGADLILHPEEYERIREVIARLRSECNAKMVFLIDKNGQKFVEEGDVLPSFTTTPISGSAAAPIEVWLIAPALVAMFVAGLGSIAELLNQTEADRTPLQKQLDARGDSDKLLAQERARSQDLQKQLDSLQSQLAQAKRAEVRSTSASSSTASSITPSIFLPLRVSISSSAIACFWRTPYTQGLTRWGTEVHDRFMLPYFVALDFDDVIEELRQAGYQLSSDWFAPHLEFRFPLAGELSARAIQLTLRQALESQPDLGIDSVPTDVLVLPGYFGMFTNLVTPNRTASSRTGASHCSTVLIPVRLCTASNCVSWAGAPMYSNLRPSNSIPGLPIN